MFVMTSKVDVATLRAGKTTSKLIFIDVHVYKHLSCDKYIVGDGKHNLVLDVEQNPEQGKDLAVGKCYRLVKPEIHKNVLTFDAACGAGLIPSFHVPKLSEKEKNKIQIPSEDDVDLITLDKVCIVTKDTTAPILFLKVVFLSTEKQSTYSKFKTAKVRDVNGNKHFIQLFGQYRDQVQSGKVYKFVSLLVQKFKLDHEPWGRMRTQPNTRIHEASETITAKFSHVSLADSAMSGTLFAHEKVYVYDCCMNCFKKVDLASKECGHCKTSIKPDQQLRSFNVTLLLANSDLQDVVRVLVFASHLDMDRGSYTEDDVQTRLEQLHMKQVTVFYDKDSERGLSIRAEALKFDESNEDSGLPSEQH